MAEEEEEDEDEADLSGQVKFGLGGINRGNRHSSTPLHLAVENANVVRISFFAKMRSERCD